MSDDPYLQRLARDVEVIMRPGVRIEPVDGELLLKVVTRDPPEADLIVFRARPVVADLAAHDLELIRGFSYFSEFAAQLIDSVDLDTLAPVVLSQELYNRGIVHNEHGLYDLFHVQTQHISHDADAWRRA